MPSCAMTAAQPEIRSESRDPSPDNRDKQEPARYYGFAAVQGILPEEERL